MFTKTAGGMLMKKRIGVFLVILMFLNIVSLAAADNLSGLQIIKNVYNRPAPKELEGELEMVLLSNNNQRVRKIKQYIKNYGDVEKKIMFFVEPANVRNTSFVNWSYLAENKNDDQWIYLPALKKIKRISSDSKGDYFMGSDFTYDDLGDRKPEEDTHKLLKTEKVGEEECFVVESIPKENDYMYSKTITWIIKDKWIGLKKEFYDEDGEHLKNLEIKKYKNQNGLWILLETEMHNIQKDSKTKMIFSNVKLDHGIADEMFTERMMKKGLK